MGTLVDKKFNMTQPFALTDQKGNCVWAAAKSAGAQLAEGGILPLHYSLIRSGLPEEEGWAAAGASPEEGHQGDQRAGAPLL